uniref:Uncharacterized protein n=1 Tax=Chromera velia CCMP2878 TaxID=1169474 RepID=A0A0G4HJJ6_9ALVE|eukprot:Cvel_28188.t1-p1 / transcript=Cvel_28188.t1 / gene=Cvel_28188 / organism=Chromera_velia_CCMP2878 / gene_product=hypothetical protein / transcript_product=hypothetical protein / location=Cvel_scaffold3645:7817-14069(+) / protein_length=793 / sequence_SO=supercontig / SO=protein_coding / is_pseudo=false
MKVTISARFSGQTVPVACECRHSFVRALLATCVQMRRDEWTKWKFLALSFEVLPPKLQLRVTSPSGRTMDLILSRPTPASPFITQGIGEHMEDFCLQQGQLPVASAGESAISPGVADAVSWSSSSAADSCTSRSKLPPPVLLEDPAWGAWLEIQHNEVGGGRPEDPEDEDEWERLVWGTAEETVHLPGGALAASNPLLRASSDAEMGDPFSRLVVGGGGNPAADSAGAVACLSSTAASEVQGHAGSASRSSQPFGGKGSQKRTSDGKAKSLKKPAKWLDKSRSPLGGFQWHFFHLRFVAEGNPSDNQYQARKATLLSLFPPSPIADETRQKAGKGAARVLGAILKENLLADKDNGLIEEPLPPPNWLQLLSFNKGAFWVDRAPSPPSASSSEQPAAARQRDRAIWEGVQTFRKLVEASTTMETRPADLPGMTSDTPPWAGEWIQSSGPMKGLPTKALEGRISAASRVLCKNSLSHPFHFRLVKKQTLCARVNGGSPDPAFTACHEILNRFAHPAAPVEGYQRCRILVKLQISTYTRPGDLGLQPEAIRDRLERLSERSHQIEPISLSPPPPDDSSSAPPQTSLFLRSTKHVVENLQLREQIRLPCSCHIFLLDGTRFGVALGKCAAESGGNTTPTAIPLEGLFRDGEALAATSVWPLDKGGGEGWSFFATGELRKTIQVGSKDEGVKRKRVMEEEAGGDEHKETPSEQKMEEMVFGDLEEAAREAIESAQSLRGLNPIGVILACSSSRSAARDMFPSDRLSSNSLSHSVHRLGDEDGRPSGSGVRREKSPPLP